MVSDEGEPAVNTPGPDIGTRLRLGMFMIGGREWRGGLNYQRTLLQALMGPLANRFEPLLFVSQDQRALAEQVFEGLLPKHIVVDDRATGAGTGRRAAEALVRGSDTAAASLMRDYSVDIIFENARFLGKRFPIPAISWMPDFQHRALPHLFTRLGRWKREIGFRAQTSGGRIVMLSSETARQACERFYPASHGRTAVVRFVPSIDIPSVLARREGARIAYGLPEQFFFMPNQFWAHKNQAVVFKALEIIRSRRQLDNLPPVVMTGPVFDNRQRDTFTTLMERSRDQSLSFWFRHLGLIAMPDVLALNAAAQEVLNPSLFEGWASSVEEAKALGSPMILSDIDVHREQAPGARFFDPNDAETLVELLLSGPQSRPSRIEDPFALTARAIRRQESFAVAFEETLDRAQAMRHDPEASY